ncbi:MAG: hypothetical protein Q4C49_05435 [Bacillota bacterium]|nr:hypothetical protein [Bacillota bacterium]
MSKKKNSTKETILTGPNIYRDKRGNAIYYDKKKNVAYKISPDKEGTFKTLQLRYVLVFIAFIIFYILFKLNLFISIGICLAIGALIEYKYRTFLRNLPQSVGFTRKDKVKPIDQMIETPINGLLLRMFLYFALAILLVVNTFVSENVNGNVALQVVSYIVAVIAGYIGYKYLTLIIRKKSNKDA